jgi:hypothetical protein
VAFALLTCLLPKEFDAKSVNSSEIETKYYASNPHSRTCY